MHTIQKTFEYRVYPNKVTEVLIQKSLDACRFVYNKTLELYGKNKANKQATQNMLPELKQQHPFLHEVYSKPLQMAQQQVYYNLRVLKALKQKGRKVGKLRFKGKNYFDYINYNQSGFSIASGQITFSKIGRMPIKLHRKSEGKIKGCILKRKKSGKYFANVICEMPVPAKKPIKSVVGIDLGSTKFLHDSENFAVDSPKYLEKSLKQCRKHCRKFSKTKKKSKNRNKRRLKLAKLQEHIANQRKDFLHKLSAYYINNYDCIAIEELNIKGMLKSRYARHFAQQGWGIFAQQLLYKAESAGKTVVQITPCHTSQRCSCCGIIAKKSLSERIHSCTSCGLSIDRDYNASLNIRNDALRKLPQELGEVTLAEMKPLCTETAQVSSMKQEAPAL